MHASWVIAHICMRHEWVIAHICMRHGIQARAAWHTHMQGHHGTHTCKGSMAHRWPRCFIYLKESFATYEWSRLAPLNEVVLHVWMREVTPMKRHIIHADESRHTHTCKWVTAHAHITHTSLLLLIWLDHITHMNLSSLTRVNASCYACKWVMSHVWKGHIPHPGGSCRKHGFIVPHVCMCFASHMNESWQTSECGMSRI